MGAIKPSDFLKQVEEQRSMEKSLVWGDEIPIGKFFERTGVPTLHGAELVLNEGPLVHRDPGVPLDVARSFIEELT